MGRKLFYTKLLLRLFLLSVIVDVHGEKNKTHEEDRKCDSFCPECSRSGCYWTVFKNESKFVRWCFVNEVGPMEFKKMLTCEFFLSYFSWKLPKDCARVEGCSFFRASGWKLRPTRMFWSGSLGCPWILKGILMMTWILAAGRKMCKGCGPSCRCNNKIIGFVVIILQIF